MAESPEDVDVDTLISQMQSTLNKLKAAQAKDVSSEDSEESSETKEETAEGETPPKTLKEAGSRHQRALAAKKAVNQPAPGP